jgi:hypothetical protein
MKVNIGSDSYIETDDETVDSLIEIHDNLQVKTNRIKDALADAKANLALKGEYADPDWFRRAKYALRASAHAKQVIIREIAKKKAALKRSEGISFEREFMRVAKLMLDKDTYHAILAEVIANEKDNRV